MTDRVDIPPGFDSERSDMDRNLQEKTEGTSVKIVGSEIDLQNMKYTVSIDKKTYDIPGPEWFEEAILEKKERENCRDEHRYPTRMHEVLGVEPEEWFTYSEYGDRRFWLSESGLLYRICDDGTSIPATQGRLVLFINNPERITRRLTEEQVAQLKALVTLGYGWIVKDLEGLPYACASKPKKERDDWRG